MSIVPILLLVSSLGQALDSESAHTVTYKGRLTPVKVSDEKAKAKGFEVTWFLPGAGGAFAGLGVVTEDSFALPWPARFAFDSPHGEKAVPQIGYRFGDRDYTVSLPNAFLTVAKQMSQGGEVVDGTFRYIVTGQETIDDRECLLVEVKTNFGRDRVLAVEKESGLVVRHEETVFLGRGDRFLLTLELERLDQLPEDRAAAMLTFAESLKKVATILGEGEQERTPFQDLSSDSLRKIADLQAELDAAARKTPFGGLTGAIAANIKDQQQRAEGVDGLAKRVIGSPAPLLSIRDIDGKRFDASVSKGNVLVLHFWEYDHDTLVAPYGQVGFLDFLARKRTGDDVTVMGIAVNSAFGDDTTRSKPARSAKALAEFMNLGFPILSDDGTLLRSLGDPRDVGAELPLWVVIDRQGIVRRYKSGLYEASAKEGLRELDEIVSELIAEPQKAAN